MITHLGKNPVKGGSPVSDKSNNLRHRNRALDAKIEDSICVDRVSEIL